MALTEEQSTRRIASVPERYTGMFGPWPSGPETAPRFAVVHGARRPEEVTAYLPDNYALMESYTVQERFREVLIVIIGGIDRAGWTLDDYVAPRLGSGLMFAREITS